MGKLGLKYGGDVVGVVAKVGDDVAQAGASRVDNVAGAAAKAPDAERAVKSAARPDFLYMYTGPEQLAKMGQSGTASRYLTPSGNLTPLQAQIELALPWYNSATTVMRVPRAAVESSVILERRVTGNVFGRGGGGMEVVLDQRPPLAWFELIR